MDGTRIHIRAYKIQIGVRSACGRDVWCPKVMRRREIFAALTAIGVVVLVAGALLVACALSLQLTSRPASVRSELLASYGAPFDVWTDDRIDRFGGQVCTDLNSDLAPSNPDKPPRWIHYWAPGVLQVFRDSYCPS